MAAQRLLLELSGWDFNGVCLVRCVSVRIPAQRRTFVHKKIENMPSLTCFWPNFPACWRIIQISWTFSSSFHWIDSKNDIPLVALSFTDFRPLEQMFNKTNRKICKNRPNLMILFIISFSFYRTETCISTIFGRFLVQGEILQLIYNKKEPHFLGA